ncbi:hypothetical protein DFJ58DRAFT_719665 [Suillus subalutaceus]|uniref:uncharacterized protein n=1 Tax=Suillus subalutaceus TaxID=48586 RepID=UPI001B874269|nr:uncharacterized protein DFJ58DRAFT_719665 [Suillus subalutaceus]KAG1829734.1 hypothetical protein DFJ58DRAFT_719665 [Suillus subalutaceus]
MVIIDKSGVHRLQVRCCDCPNAMSPDLQMVLDDFLLDNLECGTSAMNYYSKLRRMTSRMFPHLWRQLKTMKWHGFGHCSDSPNAGDLALFCPACPQPGINVSFSGDESPDEWKYTRSFVMDGNFKAEHLHPMKPFDEVWLSDGLGFMKHFRVRVDRSRFLEMVPELTIIPGIGLWHIHGHQDSCYVRYASNFIEGIGRIDGEIMETLWSRLNLISPAARGMSSPHRKEYDPHDKDPLPKIQAGEEWHCRK